jgi:integrase-like protein
MEKQSADRIVISRPESPRELRLWLTDQLTLLAEACGEELTAARIRIYAEDLADLSRTQLQTGLTRARRELRFFPEISELRDFAGAKVEDAQQVDTNAAWEFANDCRYGVVKYDRDNRPPLPGRIEYALRRIGGLSGLNQVTAESFPFKYKEFCEAYRLAPMADVMVQQLAEKFPIHQLVGDVQPRLPVRSLLTQCMIGKSADDFVFTREDGKPVKCFRTSWRNVCASAGVKLMFHDLRRTAARNLRRAGVAETVIMKIGGWKTNDMFRRYAIVCDSDLADAMSKLETSQQNAKMEQRKQDAQFSPSGHHLGIIGTETHDTRGASSVPSGDVS